MTKYIILILLLAIYLMLGGLVFSLAVEIVGGKEAYIEEIHKDHPNQSMDFARACYISARFLVVLFWPYFLLKGVIKK